MISAGAVAKDGIARKIGDKKREIPNRIAVVRDVKPVRPPSVTPEALSTNVVVVEVPSTRSEERRVGKEVRSRCATY